MPTANVVFGLKEVATRASAIPEKDISFMVIEETEKIARSLGTTFNGNTNSGYARISLHGFEVGVQVLEHKIPRVDKTAEYAYQLRVDAPIQQAKQSGLLTVLKNLGYNISQL